ncbi:type II toxin-antitoxin system RelE family toxin [Laspinema olomoucense]|uniref:Type II toxin-antitoxin system RelE/ParE family toxin n=1 Tax=Laspinema olomoucense D3b TaxID=2953688 RepID=A0ABT2N8H4_9CYAN|nr:MULTISPECIES: type II toxin-antitoxin system RelE/ParE family toxin [unclassified Laspinema]MCT7978149.1 type II toxin-antitoxin system RelE/ParE family toxin [Laspinema sp. D3b]MCT7997378.1 type II toxin-antitoxin system RelE/ParE family toxin [Laspinema sp. D3c]
MANEGYAIRFKKSAAKELRSLDINLQLRIGEAIDTLSFDPRPPGVVKLKGDDNLYRIRIGDYRVVYVIDDQENVVRIVRVKHRRDAYQT